MKKPYLLLFSFYFGLIVFMTTIGLFILNFLKNLEGNITLSFLIIGLLLWFTLFLIGNISNIFNLLNNLKVKDIKSVYSSIKILKLGSIPFYILNFIVTGIFFAFIFFATRGIGLILLPIPVLITWIILLSTSVNSISFLVFIYKNRVITKKSFILNLLAQLTFVIDIISTIIILKKEKKIIE
jgi:hypothetical protein